MCQTVSRFLSFGSKTVMEIRFKYLLKGSKETALGKGLTALFPTVYAYVTTYTLLLLGIIPEFVPNMYAHCVFFLSLIFLALYSFFNEVLYDSIEDMQNTVLLNALLSVVAVLTVPKL